MQAFDVICPDGNEEAMIEAARVLGWRQIVLLYQRSRQKPSLQQRSGLGVRTAFLVDSLNDVNMAARNHDYVCAPMERQYTESKGVHFLLDASDATGRDFFYQRRGGLDDAMSANLSNGSIVILQGVGKSDSATAMGRLAQNLSLARAHKVTVVPVTLARNPLDLRAPKDLDAWSRCCSQL